MKNACIAIITLALLFFSDPISASEDRCKDIKSVGGYASHIISVNEDDIGKLEEYCQIYLGIQNREPDYINKALSPIIERSNGLAFLKDIDFKIKTFEAKDGENGLGFSYNYHKTNELSKYVFNQEKNLTTGISWNFSAKGNVAFDSQINPADFMDNRISISGFRDYGGVSKVATTATFEELNKLDAEAAQLEGETLKVNRQKVKAIVSEFLTIQTYMDYDLNAGLESNQNFTQKQWTYGAKFSIDIKSYGKNSQLCMWNIFDYPFAFLRIFSGYGGSNEFKPLGSTFPTFVVGIDQVDPVENNIRESLGENGKFDRFKGEAYLRSPIATIGGKDLFVNIDYRYWKELDPSDAIKAAQIDEFDYTTLSVSSANGVYISYSDGKLPFDQKDQQLYELGWKFNLN